MVYSKIIFFHKIKVVSRQNEIENKKLQKKKQDLMGIFFILKFAEKNIVSPEILKSFIFERISKEYIKKIKTMYLKRT